jgi:hypothetical protein
MSAIGLVLVCIGIAGAAALAAVFTPTARERLATVGAVLAALTWAVLGMMIYRGPDDGDLTELGWTVMAGVLCAGFLAAWMIGLSVGRLVRGARTPERRR